MEVGVWSWELPAPSVQVETIDGVWGGCVVGWYRGGMGSISVSLTLVGVGLWEWFVGEYRGLGVAGGGCMGCVVGLWYCRRVCWMASNSASTVVRGEVVGWGGFLVRGSAGKVAAGCGT